MPDCRLEFRMHAGGSASSQIDRRFPWFSSVVTEIVSCYPNCTLHSALLMQLFRCEHRKSVPVLYCKEPLLICFSSFILAPHHFTFCVFHQCTVCPICHY